MLVERETDVSHCFFVTCADVYFDFTLLSHDDELHLCEILSVQSYEICDSPSVMVVWTVCLRDDSQFKYHSACTGH